MTNSKKSFGIPVVALLVLAFCCMLIVQGAIARQDPKLEYETFDGVVPLPGSDEAVIEKRAPKRERRSAEVFDALTDITGAAPYVSDVRFERPSISASVEQQGGDTYATAAVLTGPFPWTAPGVFTGTTVGYNADYDATLCGSPNSTPDVVYSYTPPADAFLDISLCGSGGTDTKLWVLEALTLTEIECNDDGDDCPGYESHIPAFSVTGLTEYYIVIGGWGDFDAGPYEIVLSEYTEGDDCEAPEAIADVEDEADYPIVVPFDMSQATCGKPDATGLNAGGWYLTFTADRPGLFTFTICDDGTHENSAFFGLGGGILCGVGATCWSYTNVAGNECADDGPFSCQAVMMPGWTYAMEIFDWCDGMTGTLEVTWEEMIAENDECADIIDLGVGNMTEFVHNVQATISPESTTYCDNVDPSTTCGDVWYRWTADETGFVQFDMCEWGESAFDSKIMVYRGGDCPLGDPDRFGCSDDGCGEFGDGGYIDMECTEGEQFVIRLAGWFSGDGDQDGTCAQEGGQGTGYLDIWQTEETTRPYNDDCPDAIVGVLGPGADVYTTPTNNLYLSQWGSCPNLYNQPDGGIGIGGAMAWMVFDAFTISECTDIRIDFCGAEDDPGYVQFSNWPQGINLFTGCPCEGPFVTIPVSSGTYADVCDPGLYPDPLFNFSRGWDFVGMLPGTYYWTTSNWHMGRTSTAGKYIYPHDFNVNFRGTPVECVYCDGWTNLNTCPDLGADPPNEVAGGSWITDVALADLDKIGTVYQQHVQNDCNSYEDHTALEANLYRGITYDISVILGKIGNFEGHDSVDVWVDWNQNSGFAAFVVELGERTSLSFNPTPEGLFWTAAITPPLDAWGVGGGATGTTRMRVRAASDADGMNFPCGEKVWGEVEDFTVIVTDIECGDFVAPPGLDADDIQFLIDWYLSGAEEDAPDFWQRADIDGDGDITLADIIALVDAAYHGGDLICIPAV